MFKATSASTGVSASIITSSTRAASASTLSVITTPAALRELEQKWRKLENQTQNPTRVFQSFDWVMAWTDTYIGQKLGTSLHILAGYEGDELVFIWPLMRARRLGFAVLTWLSDPFGQYGDVLCAKGQNSKHWISSSISFLNRLKDVDILRLRHVREDSHLFASAGMLVSARVPDKAPCLDFTLFADEAAYDARYSSVQRKRRKKIRKAIEELGAISFTRLPVGSVADAAIKQAIAEKNAWLKERGRINRVLGCPGHLDFLKALSRRMGGPTEVVVTEIKAGERPVSWEVGFRHNGIHYGYITSHVNALTDLSPGRLHMDLSQRACLNDGMKSFDLMVPNDAHKESWSSTTVNTEDYFLPLSPLGHVIGHGYLRWVRPVFRKIYYSLDSATLRRLNVKDLLAKLFKSQEVSKHD
jgi:CelD/BcsL family acetyltransferase involved in cellulose biosynthesis